MLKIEKFIGEKREQNLHFPNLVVWMARRLLPNAAQIRLAAKGISLPAIEEARKNGKSWQAELTVLERGIQKRVVVTLT
jgi:hypothetical protein